MSTKRLPRNRGAAYPPSVGSRPRSPKGERGHDLPTRIWRRPCRAKSTLNDCTHTHSGGQGQPKRHVAEAVGQAVKACRPKGLKCLLGAEVAGWITRFPWGLLVLRRFEPRKIFRSDTGLGLAFRPQPVPRCYLRHRNIPLIHRCRGRRRRL